MSFPIGTYYDIHVKRGNDGHLYVYMPSENNSDKKRSLAANKACLSFIYKKYPLGGGKQTVDLEVAVWRSGQQGPYTEFKVSSNANGWMTHKKSVPVFDDIYSVSKTCC